MQLPSGERLVWRGHPSARSHLVWFLQWGIIAVVPVALAGIMQATGRDIEWSLSRWAILSGCLLIGLIVFDTLRRAMTDYVVTDRRVRVRRGVVARGDQTVELAAVRSITARRSRLDRALGIGDVLVEADEGGAFTALTFVGVVRPDHLARRLDQYRVAALDPHQDQ